MWSLRLDSAETPRQTLTDDLMFATVNLKAQHADTLGGARPGMPQYRCMELETLAGDANMPLSRPTKRLSRSDGELAELHTPLVEPLLDPAFDRGRWQSCSPASRTGRGTSDTIIGDLPRPKHHHALGGRAAAAH